VVRSPDSFSPETASLRRLSRCPTRALDLAAAERIARAAGLAVSVEDGVEGWYNDKCSVVVWTSSPAQ
jgi:hypothetical protein